MTSRKSQRKRSNPAKKRTPFESKGVKIGIIVIFIAIVAIAAIYLFSGSGEEDNGVVGNPIAVFDTTMGTIKVELFEDKVPITAGNFKDLANDNFYDGTKFHRISPGFMIQGGDPKSKDNDPSDDGTGGPGYSIDDEFHDELKNLRGMISMANSGPNTGGSQFFILVADASWLDGAHAVFGQVIEGMGVVDNIANMDHDGRFDPNPGGGRPITDVVINSITIEYQ
ncbi:MAG: peptidylprolyl isomerase [Thermoplasmatales archaeon]|nr:MAG: peptidylprolyl isomerase [Thermoplasmatales archaeon]